MHDAVGEDPHIGLLEGADLLSALHALGEHGEDLPRELLDFGVGRSGSNVHVNHSRDVESLAPALWDARQPPRRYRSHFERLA